jgi:Domain of unknown function (DUF4396)
VIDFGFLAVLADPTFVAAWYGLGLFGAVLVALDATRWNSSLPAPLRVAWPLFVVFSSGFGVLLYLLTCRPFRGPYDPQQRWWAHHRGPFRRLTAATVYSIAGESLAIVATLAIAQVVGAPLWTALAAAWAVSLGLGWFVFQTWAMRRRGHRWLRAWARAGRVQFVAMVPVIAAVALVQGVVVPLVVSGNPPPSTAAFWGFAGTSVAAAWVVSVPVQAWMFGRGWKHAMG